MKHTLKLPLRRATRRLFLSFALSALTLAALPLAAPKAARAADVGAAPRAALGPSDALRVQGKNLVKADGAVVLLRGVNIGGWLVPEGWMNGQTDHEVAHGGREAQEKLEARFGPQKADALLQIWRDNWFTAQDLDLIQSWNFNLIRVPFGFRNLQNADGSWKRAADGAIDFGRMDWVVREAARRGIYVIFDYHVWPGQHENYQQISRLEPKGDAERAQAAALWSEVARHFKGNPAIAGFDLVNEPEGSPGDVLQRALTESIRAQDADRIVIGESQGYANFADPGWKNAVYSAHYPLDDAPGSAEEKVARWAQKNGISEHPEVQVPIFIGEMKAPEDTLQSAAALARAMNERGWNWAVWTYKTVDMGGWGGFNLYDSMRYDLSKDSYESLQTKWSQELSAWRDPAQPRNFYFNNWWIDGFKAGAAGDKAAG